MAGMKQPRFQVPVHTEHQRRFSNAILRMVGVALFVLGIMLSWLGMAKAQQAPNSLQHRKADLEVQKLELEVDKLREKPSKFPGWLTGVLALLVGAAGTGASVWMTRRTRIGALDQSVHDKRLEFYPKLVQATSGLAVYFPSDDPTTKQISTIECWKMGQAMSNWYFKDGGLLLSKEARDAYFKLARALTRAALAEALRVPTYPRDAEQISVETVDDYRKKLAGKYDLNDVEKWRFGGPDSKEPADMFKDYVFLQRLSSALRTKLSKDLRSRRRPS